VAIQSKIGDSPVRVSGVVAEIIEDTSGHPVVTLHTGSDNRADMFLTDDQRSAAAQLSKEEAVEIQSPQDSAPGAAGAPPQPTPGVGPSSIPTAAVAPTTVADDLASVRTKDPDAADRIVSYCNKLTSSATDPTTAAARCRRDEMAAWTRLISQNEFPALDESSRRKCSEPPFPDSYVARESCAKYQLHLD
jgi:hypothetical protein